MLDNEFQENTFYKKLKNQYLNFFSQKLLFKIIKFLLLKINVQNIYLI